MNRIKTIAMYLPQFHEVPENNEWWGEGYTEWIAAKKAEKLFDGHYQPREPLNDNYYDLMDKSTMLWQAEIARQYLLDGFCFYHYYFKEGRKILEKPAENLLKWKDVNMPFCFCWANESWGRTWSKINYEINEWLIEDEKDHKNPIMEDEILLDQKYGREAEWRKHIEYLLPFFQDKRYIRKNGAPVFLIYKPERIGCLPEMINLWKNVARQNGINDIYIIGLSILRKMNGIDAVLLNGPLMYFTPRSKGIEIDVRRTNGVKNYDYKSIWENALKAEPIKKCKTYYGVFTDYDDTPRRGKKGTFLHNVSLGIFEKYLYLLMKKNLKEDNEFLFINAFNEWGEGMCLEPDKKNKYGYLEILRNTKIKVNGKYNKNSMGKSKNADVEENKFECEIEKQRDYIVLLDKWMTLKEQKRYVSDYLKKYDCKKIAVYGLGVLGRHLVSELLQEGVAVEYIIDQNESLVFPGIKVCRLGGDMEKVDAIIVTVTYDYKFGDILDNIRRHRIDCPVMSLEEIINELY